ncbi:MAG: aromatic acid exporter family protein [Brooklawnia sp.]|uniref:FUSC family protein n=1 Tax=Brooklawnia sp. TaxID=2699740 RepID=UPI003C77446B
MVTKPKTHHLRDKLRKIWPGLPSSIGQLRSGLRNSIEDVARLTLATVLGYLLTTRLLSPPADLTGALTALLVVQASLRGSFRAGMVRVIAVVTGISIAMSVAAFVGLHWWSLALVVFVALMMARVLRLESGSAEVAISAMLILGSAGADVAAFNRFANTIIGTTVGIVLPLLWPRRVKVPDLTRDLRHISGRLTEIFRSAAKYLTRQPMTKDAASGWLVESRHITPLIASATTTLDEAADVQRYNTRQIFNADVVPLLRSGLEAVERCLLASRNLFRTIQTAAPEHPTPDDGYGEQVRPALVDVLERLGRAIETFTELIEADVTGQSTVAEERHEAAMDQARIAAANLTALMRVDTDQTGLWLTRGTILSAVENILNELDLTEYREVRHQWQASQLGRALPAGSIGPRIRSPWGQFAQQRLRARAAQSRIAYPEGSHQVSSDDTTALMPSIEQPPRPPRPTPAPEDDQPA